VIQIDRVRTHVDVVGSTPQESPRQAPTAPTLSMDPAERNRFREFMLDVLRDHLRDLEREGLA
jgi:hypothetical protein